MGTVADLVIDGAGFQTPNLRRVTDWTHLALAS